MNVLSVPEEKIDLSSFYYCANKCISYGYTSNIAFIEQTNIQSNIQDLLSTFRGLIAYSQGKFKLKMDEKNKTSVKTLTELEIMVLELFIKYIDSLVRLLSKNVVLIPEIMTDMFSPISELDGFTYEIKGGAESISKQS